MRKVYMDTFGEWLRQRRDQQNLTRKQLAERVGCSIDLLRKIEDGERHASEQIAELIANSLNIPPGERSTFVKVARGELSVDRLPPVFEAGGCFADSPDQPPHITHSIDWPPT